MTETNNHKSLKVRYFIREVVFGLEDGMVSTLGAITGIAVGSSDIYTILLAGIVIIAVESISMGIGSYISNSSSKEVEEKFIDDEKEALSDFSEKGERNLYRMFVRDGWNKKMAMNMVRVASSNKKLMLKEYEYRELGVFPYQHQNPLTNAFFMFISYIVGGIFPLFSYFIFPLPYAIFASVTFTMLGLFLLGAVTTIYTNVKPLKAGLRLLLMGGVAFFIGITVGKVFSFFNGII